MKKTKGKTYEEIYGIQKAKEIKEIRRQYMLKNNPAKIPEVRKKMSEAKKGEKNPMYGKKFTEEHKRKISEEISGKNHPFYGKHHTEESKRKMSEGQKGKKFTEETRRKISENHVGMLGRKHTEETKRKMSEAKKGIYIGENNPNWQDGIGKLPYAPDWGPKVKRKVLERDNHECRNCGELENLAVHHINYDKMNCDSTNLITLCLSCNGRANGNRNYWKKLYEKEIKNEI